MITKEECVNAFNRLSNKAISANFYNGTTFLDACENQLEVFRKLIKEHFYNNPINWLKNCMGEDAFNVVFSSEEEVKKWIDRVNWHVKKVDELGRKLQELKSNPPLKFEELKEDMWVWDNKTMLYIRIAKVIGKTIYVEDFIYGYDCYGRYEENRFYRKQVEE